MFGYFDFIQNGGTFNIPLNFTFARRNGGVKFSYTLNGGRFYLGGWLSGVADPSRNIMNLNGGTYAAGASDFITRETFTLNVGGEVTFEVADTKTLTIRDDSATAASVVKTGAGSLMLDGALVLNGLDVQAGSVTLTDKMLTFANSDAPLSIAKTAKLNLDYDDQMTFKTLKLGDRGRAAGVYSASQGPNAVKRVLGGVGTIQILEGSDPGIVIKIR